MLDTYKTVRKRDAFELVEKKSRFIATVDAVQNEEEARRFIDEIKKDNWNAAHNVFAYQIGDQNEIQRYSDDGEPSGTAGIPVLNVLKGENIQYGIIVVTRYFGGTLLGTGGLVRAYGHAAKEGLLKAGIIEKQLYQQMEIAVSYTLSGKVQHNILLNEGCAIVHIDYSDSVLFQVVAPAANSEFIQKKINQITSAQAVVKLKGQCYGVIQNGEWTPFLW